MYKCEKCGNFDLIQKDDLSFYCDRCGNENQEMFKEED